MFSLAGKTALVTGGASGIGAAIAQCFGLNGALTHVADVNAEGADQIADSIRAQGGRARSIALDLARAEDISRVAAEFLAANDNRCDVLVNCAGLGHVGTIETTNPDDFDRLWSVNVRGMFLLTRAILPSMVARRWGSVVNISSIAGMMGMYDRFAYCTTKHAVIGMTQSMALDYGETRVRINAISPGRVETPFVQARLAEYPDPKKYYDQMCAPHALKRMAQPAEIASAALYLAADESAFVTGSNLVIDGGYTAGK